MTITLETIAPPRPRTASRRALRVLPVLLPVLLFLWTGWRGIDFGHHWDEPLLLSAARTSVETGVLLPHDFYNYPSVSYWLCMASAASELRAAKHASLPLHESTLTALDGLMGTQTYLLRTRVVFLLVASLSLLWTYLLVLAWRRSVWEAFAAACLLGLSWEMNYHARWVAPDLVMTQFGALTMLLLVLSRRFPGRAWLLPLAAAAAGLACGSKYNGALLLLPVLLAAWQANPAPSARPAVRTLLPLVALFVGTYLLTTPGTLLEPQHFLGDVLHEVRHYHHGQFGSTVPAGPVHLWRNLLYLSVVLFSHIPAIALCAALLSLLGIYALARDDKHGAVVWLSFPVLYLVFVSAQHMMVARNLLVLAPFLAVFAARGLAFAWGRLGTFALAGRAARLMLTAAVAAAFFVNGAFLVRAAHSIRERRSDAFVIALRAYVQERPGTRFYASPRVASVLCGPGSTLPPNVVRDAGSDTSLVLTYASETNSWWLPWTTPNLIVDQFGPWEVNFNYYPGWAGEDRIIVMQTAKARRLGVLPALP